MDKSIAVAEHLVDRADGQQTRRLRLLFILPLALTIIIIVLVLSFTLYMQGEKRVEDGVVRVRASIQSFYDESIRYDASALMVAMDSLSRNDALREALARKDRLALLRLSKPLFDDFKSHFNITHFYYTGTDTVNLLRVHMPLRYGDTIKRVTMKQAQQSGITAYGVELGPLGTLTLRLVSPWYDAQTNELIGYVELGMEIDLVLAKLKKFFGVEVFSLVHKEYLDRARWEAGMRALGRTPDWDRFPSAVVSEMATSTIPPYLYRRLAMGDLITQTRIVSVMEGNSTYRITTLPLLDAAGRAVAQMILAADVSSEVYDARSTAYAGSFTAISLGIALITFFYWLVGKIGRHIDQTELALNDLATHDGLTQLYNQKTFYILLEKELTRARRYRQPLSLLMLDIDHFKQVNDLHGHLAGDCVLSELSARLKQGARAVDMVCRYGGEEICIILPTIDTSSAEVVAERFRKMVEDVPFAIDDGKSVDITVSIGVVAWSENVKDPSTLVTHADIALYKAKSEGRNQVQVYQGHPIASGVESAISL